MFIINIFKCPVFSFWFCLFLMLVCICNTVSVSAFIPTFIITDTLLYFSSFVWLVAQALAACTCGQSVNQIQTFHSSALLEGLDWPLFWPCGPFYRLRNEQQKRDSATVHREMNSVCLFPFIKIWPYGILEILCFLNVACSVNDPNLNILMEIKSAVSRFWFSLRCD